MDSNLCEILHCTILNKTLRVLQSACNICYETGPSWFVQHLCLLLICSQMVFMLWTYFTPECSGLCVVIVIDTIVTLNIACNMKATLDSVGALNWSIETVRVIVGSAGYNYTSQDIRGKHMDNLDL
jgi:hypothetical protein